VKDGAVVYGEQVITSPLDISHFVTDSFVTDGIWVVFGFTLCFLLIAFLVVSLAPRQLGRVTTCIENNRARSFFVGLLLLILTPVIIGLLTFTIIGIPIVAVLPLAYLVALGMGMMTCGRTFLRLRATDPGGRSLSNMASALLGVAAYMGLWAGVAILLGSASSVAEGFGITLLVISILATVWPFLTGLGAVVLTRFGFREYISFQERTAAGVVPAPAPPPMPRTPPISPAVPPPPRDGSGPEPPPLSTPDR
ncbi:MAG: hypothetical protein KKA42_11310, partial [candidate division Zixibacteria bacterium]|nr:hypothetical protein [candidate division Zixibacteria bacterium]